MSTQRFIRGQRALGIYGTSNLSRPPQRLPEPDIKPTAVLGCTAVPLPFSEVVGFFFTSTTTPDGSTAVLLALDPGIGELVRYVYDTSDWSLLDSDVLTFDALSSGRQLFAGDDGYIYNEYASGGTNRIWRWPILGSGGAPSLWASYSGSDFFNGFNGIIAFGPSGEMYAGGQDGTSGDAVLVSLDTSTGARTDIYSTSSYQYLEPLCCTLDGAIWGWAIGPSFEHYLFRWDGSLLIVDEFVSANTVGGLYPCSDNSIGMMDGNGNGVRVSPTGEQSAFDCLDGFYYAVDHNGPAGPNLAVPAQYLPYAIELTC